jgi:hypothetical protein
VLRDECEATLIDAQGNVVVPSVTLSRTTAIAAIANQLGSGLSLS